MFSSAYVWAKVLIHLEERLSAVTVSTWFDDAEVVELNEEHLILYSPSDFRREVIRPETAEADAYDTVIMNPPFGAQNEHADRPFIEAALISAPVVWGIFNKGSIPFIQAYTKDTAEITDKVSAKLSIPKQFFFHTKDIIEIPVEIVRLERHD